MSTTHDYDTASILAINLNSTHILVGESGGLSAVYNVEPRYAIGRGSLAVETEHGTLYLDDDDEVTILAGDELARRPPSPAIDPVVEKYYGGVNPF